MQIELVLKIANCITFGYALLKVLYSHKVFNFFFQSKLSKIHNQYLI